jgi:DNA topoisomerase-1
MAVQCNQRGRFFSAGYFLGENMALIIVESPNKIPKIKKAAGSGYTVMASVGHIMDLEKKDMGISMPNFDPVYVVNKDKKDVVESLKKEAKNHKDIYIATDPDKEGESIAFNILEILPKKGKNIYRIAFKELTKTAITAAIKNPVGFNHELFAAQQARRMTDRMVGFKVSPVMWSKGLKKTSAGRVQSATLKWLVEREKEIRAFVKEEYWTIHAKTKLGFDADFYGIGVEKVIPKTKEETDSIISAIKGDLVVSEYIADTRSRSPYAPFITATLQQEASTKFGWTSKRVMDTAQNLFSSGLITYHRTDSFRNEASKIEDIRDRIEQKYGKTYLSPSPRTFKNEDTAQDAHEAIRPTFEPVPTTLANDEVKLLELITNRFMASQMADAEFDQSSITLEYKSKKKYVFKTSGSIMKFDGFTKVYGTSSKDVILPYVKKGQSIVIDELIPEQHFTKAPPRYTEASFTNKMKKDGVGRPSTYATVPETLIDHKYIIRDKKNLKPTEVGMMVSDYLSVYFKDITDAKFTAKMESDLDNIASGNKKIKEVMTSFYDLLISELDVAKKGTSKEIFKTETKCPTCANDSLMSRKIGDDGVFLGCENWPKCGHIMNIDEDGNLSDAQVETGIPCPECSSGKVVEKTGKWGKWFFCSSHPVCTWKGKLDENGNIVGKKPSGESTGIKCEVCKDGEMVKRSGRFGNFLGCSKYPKCKTIINLDSDGKQKAAKDKKVAKDTGKICPECKKSNLVERPSKYGSGVWVSCGGFPKCKYIKK